MRVAYLMSGNKGEEALKEYKEGDGSHRMNSEYFSCLVFYDFLHTSFV